MSESTYFARSLRAGLYRRAITISLCLILLVAAGVALGQEGGVISGDLSSGREAPARDRSLILNRESSPMFGAVDESSYIIGPGDALFVAVGTQNYDSPVGPDGSIVIASFPPIFVGGKTLADGKKLVTEKLKRYYQGGGIYVALSGTKRFQVSVTGAVNSPGLYVVSTGSRLSQVIQSAGKMARHASHEIQIQRANGKTETVNLGAYFSGGEISQNPYLAQGDQVFVKSVDYSAPIIYVQNRSGLRIVQLLPGDNIESLIARSSDFENSEDWDHVNVHKDGRLVEKVLRSGGSEYKPVAGTTLEVRATQLNVFVGGTVVAPGAQVYNPTFTILDYVAMAGITVNSGSPSDYVVLDAAGKVRKADARKEAPRPGDHILVPRSVEAVARDYTGLTVGIANLAIAILNIMILTNQ